MKREHAYKLREMIVKAAVSLPDEDALNAVELFPAWAADTAYAVDVRIRYGDKLYRCVQSHTSQAHYTPDMIPAIWTEVSMPGVIPVWKRPTGAHDAYQTGDPVLYPDENGDVWVSTVDNNTWEPGVYGWECEGE